MLSASSLRRSLCPRPRFCRECTCRIVHTQKQPVLAEVAQNTKRRECVLRANGFESSDREGDPTLTAAPDDAGKGSSGREIDLSDASGFGPSILAFDSAVKIPLELIGVEEAQRRLKGGDQNALELLAMRPCVHTPFRPPDRGAGHTLENDEPRASVYPHAMHERKKDGNPKRAILRSWETDARALQRADDEGMQLGERSRLHDVEIALACLDAKAGGGEFPALAA